VEIQTTVWMQPTLPALNRPPTSDSCATFPAVETGRSSEASELVLALWPPAVTRGAVGTRSWVAPPTGPSAESASEVSESPPAVVWGFWSEVWELLPVAPRGSRPEHGLLSPTAARESGTEVVVAPPALERCSGGEVRELTPAAVSETEVGDRVSALSAASLLAEVRDRTAAAGSETEVDGRASLPSAAAVVSAGPGAETGDSGLASCAGGGGATSGVGIGAATVANNTSG
jgi:hypothetical protein